MASYEWASTAIGFCLLPFVLINLIFFTKESRQYSLERLSWCVKRLLSIESYLDGKTEKAEDNDNDCINESINVSTMYFVNWIDHTFQVLGKLSDSVYQTDFKDAEQHTDQWKNKVSF